MVGYAVLRFQRSHPLAVVPFYRPGFFFNNPEHLGQQSQQPCCTIIALNQTTQQVEARCTFFVEAGRAVSPLAAPFGSVEFAETLPEPVLQEVIEALIGEARAAGCHTLHLVNYPNCYAPNQAERLTHQLIEQGFQVGENNLNFYVEVTDAPFEAGLHRSERRRLQKCRRANFQVEHWPQPDLSVVTSFLDDVYQRQRYQLPLSLDYLADLIQQFANEFLVFVVKDGDTIAALTVAVRVRDDILYNFLPASHPDYRLFSPAVMLTDSLFTFCRQQGIRLLDLGVSLDGNRQPKPSLMRFKRNLGARESPKLVFEKQL